MLWFRELLFGTDVQFMCYSFMNLKNKDLIGYFLHLSIKICNWNSFSQKKTPDVVKYMLLFLVLHIMTTLQSRIIILKQYIVINVLYRPNDLCFENTISFCSTLFIKCHPFLSQITKSVSILVFNVKYM